MATARDVAADIIARNGGQIDTWALHKLMYYAQAWSLVWDRRAIFADRIEAWKDGPVVRSVYPFHRELRTVDAATIGGDASVLTPDERATVDAVFKFYSPLEGRGLRDLSHREGPWITARGGVAADAPSTTEISQSAIAAYYGKLPTTGKTLPTALMAGIEMVLSVPEDRAARLFKKSTLTMDEVFAK